MDSITWNLSQTTAGLIIQWICTIYTSYLLIRGTLNLIISISQFSARDRYNDHTLNCFHLILSLCSELDQAYNPLNLIRSSTKKLAQRVETLATSQMSEISELKSSLDQLQRQIDILQIQRIEGGSLKFLNTSYEWMGRTASGLLTHSFFPNPAASLAQGQLMATEDTIQTIRPRLRTRRSGQLTRLKSRFSAGHSQAGRKLPSLPRSRSSLSLNLREQDVSRKYPTIDLGHVYDIPKTRGSTDFPRDQLFSVQPRTGGKSAVSTPSEPDRISH